MAMAAASVPTTELRVAGVIAVLGGTRAAARLLGVAPSQVSRWARGQSSPGPEHLQRLIELDHVIAQAQLLWATDELVRDWLTSFNFFLDARPLDIVMLQGAAPVVSAIRAELSGAYP
jgi:transcriptional regulator with XRE-family HTH domain